MNRLYPALLACAAALTPAAASAESLSIYPDAEATSTTLPFSIYYASNGDIHTQMIYPAADIAALKGKTIDKIAFTITRIGNQAWNCKGLTVKMGTTTQATYPDKQYISDNLVVVASLEAFTLSNTDLTAPCQWEITLDTPFAYTGDNLVIDMLNTKDNGPRYWTFKGQAQTGYTGLSMTNSVRQEKFLPTLTVEYSQAAQASAALSASAVAFPLEFVGDNAQATVRLSNTGTQALSGTVAIDSEGFSVSPAAVTDLAAGESVDLTVDFNPAAQGKYTGTLTVTLYGIDPLTASISGTAVDGPSEVRTIFSGKEYDTAVPAGWNAYAEEYLAESGAFSGSTTEYDEFGSVLRFESAAVSGYDALLWNHGNPMPYSEIYDRYYYLISPMAGGELVLGATLNDVAATGAYVKAYSAVYDAAAAKFTIGDEIALTWDEAPVKDTWSIGKGTAPAGTQVALLLKYAAVNFFASEAKVDGITSVSADADSPAVYFNLNGVRVDRPAAGLYIRLSGGKATKVVVR